MDRTYLGSPKVEAVLDHEQQKNICYWKRMTSRYSKESSNVYFIFITIFSHCMGLISYDCDDAVVWKSLEKKSKTMVDFGDNKYKGILYVDGANWKTNYFEAMRRPGYVNHC